MPEELLFNMVTSELWNAATAPDAGSAMGLPIEQHHGMKAGAIRNALHISDVHAPFFQISHQKPTEGIIANCPDVGGGNSQLLSSNKRCCTRPSSLYLGLQSLQLRILNRVMRNDQSAYHTRWRLFQSLQAISALLSSACNSLIFSSAKRLTASIGSFMNRSTAIIDSLVLRT